MNYKKNKADQEEILNLLHKIETTFDVNIMLAVEAGSRMRGLEAPGSDYDVRFVYMPSLAWYTALGRKAARDVIDVHSMKAKGIELPEHIDLVGFELTKFLNLVITSNRGALEILGADTLYVKSIMTQDLLNLAALPHNMTAIYAAYHGEARAAFFGMKPGQGTVKEWLAILGSLMSAQVAKIGKVPPTRYSTLLWMCEISKPVKEEMEMVALRKRAGYGHVLYQPSEALVTWVAVAAEKVPYPEPANTQPELRAAAELLMQRAVNLYYKN